ncbi:MAG: hypothetical protein HQK51_03035 [Oligoflexia bacterium]|nr:hypothetical protein [Oligoflexia bacterium]
MFKIKFKLSPYLEIFSVIYILIPNFIFFSCWPQIPIAIFLTLLLVISSFLVIKNLYNDSNNDNTQNKYQQKFETNLPTIFICLIGIILWVYFSGIGGFYFQNGDYEKHNAIFYDLANFDWPLTYLSPASLTSDLSTQKFPMVYYFGYYLTPTLIEKFTSLAIHEWFILIWSIVGISLVFLWIVKLTNKFTILSLIFMIFFSGLDLIGYILYKGHLPTSFSEHIEYWTWVWQFSSNTTMLNWVPHQIIPAWILTPYIIHRVFEKKDISDVFFISSMSLMWTSFISIGLFPFVVIGSLLYFNKKVFSFQNIIAAIFIVPILALFFISVDSHVTHGWVMNIHPKLKFYLWVPIFIFLEIGIYYLFIYKKIIAITKNDFKKYSYVIIAFLSLITVLFYHYGEFNDLGMRASIPALCILQIFLWRHLPPLKIWYRSISCYIFFLLFIIGAAAPLMEMIRSHTNPQFYIPYISLPYWGRKHIHLTSQYFGKGDSFFFKYIAKQPNEKSKLQVIPQDVWQRFQMFRRQREEIRSN